MPDADEFGPFKAEAAKLHLRSSDGQVFGPVPLSTLRHWAAEGRVTAGDEVSHDGALWVRVETLPDLKLEWNGESPNGSPFGPFNLLAVPHLVQRGLIGPHSYLRNRASGKQLAVDALLRLENRDVHDGALLSTPPPIHAESAGDGMTAGDPLAPGLRAADERLQQELREKLASAEDQCRALRAELDGARQNEEEIRALRQEIQELQHGLSSLGAEKAELQNELLAREVEIHSREEACSERERQLLKQIDVDKHRRDEMERTLEELSLTREAELRDDAQRQQQLEQTTVALDACQREIAPARAAARDLERRTNEALARIEAAESQAQAAAAQLEGLQSLADETQRLKARLAEMESRKEVEQTARRSDESAQQEALRARMRDLEEESTNSTALLEQLRRELDEQRHKCKGLKAASATAEAGAAEIVELKRVLADERVAGETARANAEAAAEEGRRRLSEAESQCERLRAELASQQAAANKFREESERKDRELAEKASAARPSVAEASWYLKTDETSVFGPIVIDDLRNWTTEGRIGPQHLVSRDQQQWVPASDLPELGMDWMVSLSDGTAFGPLSLGAIGTLVKDGAVPADAKITHRSS